MSPDGRLRVLSLVIMGINMPSLSEQQQLHALPWFLAHAVLNAFFSFGPFGGWQGART
jgi:hypothetical protein